MMINKMDIEIFLANMQNEKIERIPLLLLQANEAFSLLAKKSLLAECVLVIWKLYGYFDIPEVSAVFYDENLLEDAIKLSIRGINIKRIESFKEIVQKIALWMHCSELNLSQAIAEFVETHKIKNKLLYELENKNNTLDLSGKGGEAKKWEKQGLK